MLIRYTKFLQGIFTMAFVNIIYKVLFECEIKIGEFNILRKKKANEIFTRLSLKLIEWCYLSVQRILTIFVAHSWSNHPAIVLLKRTLET